MTFLLPVKKEQVSGFPQVYETRTFAHTKTEGGFKIRLLFYMRTNCFSPVVS